MNRRRSSESLDNGNDDIICSSSGSSSPTNFTSDDETSTENLLLMSGQPSAKLRSRAHNSGQPIKTDKYSLNQRYHQGYQIQPRLNIIRNPGGSLIGQNNRPVSNQFGYLVDRSEPHTLASTSYYDDSPMSTSRLNSNIDLTSRAQEISDSSSIALLPEQSFGDRRINQVENLRSMNHHRRVQNLRAGSSSNNFDEENSENLHSLLTEEECYGENLFVDSDQQLIPSISDIASSSRNMSTIEMVMCAKLIACRTIREAAELVDLNRDLIGNITRTVTRSAPAFQNYDIGNYEIDFVVKESFNPNFWLDREPIVTTADGNCQYHAVSLSLTGSEENTTKVRLAAAVAVVENRDWFDSMLKLIDRGNVIDLVHTIARNYSWGDETTLKAIAVAINRRIFLYTCNIGKKDFEMVKSLSKEELLDAFREKKYRGGTGIHAYADPIVYVPPNNYIMLFHKSEHFIAVLPTTQQPTMFEPYNPILPMFN